MRVLGLDISTSITGVTLVGEEKRIIHYEAIDTRNPNKFCDLFDKVSAIQERLVWLFNQYEIEEIFIEQSLQMFRPGMSSAKTLSTLSRCNGMISWICYEISGIKPQYIAATTARKLNDIKIPQGFKSKEIVMKYLLDNEPSFRVEFTPSGNPKPCYYDIADSIIIARAGQIQCLTKK